MFIAELNDPAFSNYNLSSLRTGIMAGSPCPIEVMKSVVDKMGAKEITIAYGQTESSPVISVAFHVRFEATSVAGLGAPRKVWASTGSDPNIKLMNK